MRTARLLGVILTILTVGLAGGCCWHRPPARNHHCALPGYVTDNAGCVVGLRARVGDVGHRQALRDRHIRLWVVYVDNFSGQSAANWAQRTYRMQRPR